LIAFSPLSDEDSRAPRSRSRGGKLPKQAWCAAADGDKMWKQRSRRRGVRPAAAGAGFAARPHHWKGERVSEIRGGGEAGTRWSARRPKLQHGGDGPVHPNAHHAPHG
jgi:hypothetical protein